MDQILRTLLALCAELIGLTLVAAGVILVGAYHYFDGFSAVTPTQAFMFSVVALTLAAGGMIGYAVVRVGQLKIQNDILQIAATRDALTRLYNRAAFKKEATAMIASIGRRRSDPEAVTLLVIDADHFKRINDSLGHAVGDKALVAIAAALAGGVRSYDLVGRLGGEEFVLLLKDAGPKEAAIVAERLRNLVNRLVVGPPSNPFRLSVSVGGVCFDRPVPFDQAYRYADRNLYRAKKAGRNRSEITDFVSGGRLPTRSDGRLATWAPPTAPDPERSSAL